MRVAIVARTEDPPVQVTETAAFPGELFELWDRLKQQMPDARFAIVARSWQTPPPKGWFPLTGWWCPYCRCERAFPWDSRRELHLCHVCGVSDHEYWVRHYNRLDPLRRDLEEPKEKKHDHRGGPGRVGEDDAREADQPATRVAVDRVARKSPGRRTRPTRTVRG